jgi:hypothetical protein
MRTIVRFKLPVEAGNEVVRSGKIGKVFEQLMADLKPEAAYFWPEGGERAGILVINIPDETWVAGVVERLCLGLGARVDMSPVMTPEDLQKSMSSFEDVIKRYA